MQKGIIRAHTLDFHNAATFRGFETTPPETHKDNCVQNPPTASIKHASDWRYQSEPNTQDLPLCRSPPHPLIVPCPSPGPNQEPLPPAWTGPCRQQSPQPRNRHACMLQPELVSRSCSPHNCCLPQIDGHHRKPTHPTHRPQQQHCSSQAKSRAGL